MSEHDEELRAELRHELRHRVRPLTASRRAARGEERRATPLELLYDLTYVIAFGAAAEELAAAVAGGHLGAGVGAYLFAIFAVGWAWLNFTWYTSAYGNDDALFRVATFVQMVGALILVFGLPQSFEDAVEGHSPNNLLLVVGYLVMRVPLIALWLRAAAHDPAPPSDHVRLRDHHHRGAARVAADRCDPRCPRRPRWSRSSSWSRPR